MQTISCPHGVKLHELLREWCIHAEEKPILGTAIIACMNNDIAQMENMTKPLWQTLSTTGGIALQWSAGIPGMLRMAHRKTRGQSCMLHAALPSQSNNACSAAPGSPSASRSACQRLCHCCKCLLSAENNPRSKTITETDILLWPDDLRCGIQWRAAPKKCIADLLSGIGKGSPTFTKERCSPVLVLATR